MCPADGMSWSVMVSVKLSTASAREIASDTQARYRPRPGGPADQIEVLNRCRTGEGETVQALGADEVMGLVEGAPAKALGALVKGGWKPARTIGSDRNRSTMPLAMSSATPMPPPRPDSRADMNVITATPSATPVRGCRRPARPAPGGRTGSPGRCADPGSGPRQPLHRASASAAGDAAPPPAVSPQRRFLPTIR